ncbi:MAG TPA: energy transducer TonB [Verrucomicrobiae bacterium]|nr:energy transducer TonB [Verrucomicrobiae bacterium]
MFADSLLEISWAQRSRRGWTTLTSFALEAGVIGLLLLIPLLRTVGLPLVHTVSTPVSAGRIDVGSAPVRPTRSAARPGVQVIPVTHGLMLPSHMPTAVYRGADDAGSVPQDPGCLGCVGVEGMPTGADGPDGIDSILRGTHPILPAAPKPTTTHVYRVSSMLEGGLIHRVQPVYPQLARDARVQGPVVLFAVISKEGTIDKLKVLSGHPMLVAAAIDAVRQWRYKPYILNNEPIEVETQITVNFVLEN